MAKVKSRAKAKSVEQHFLGDEPMFAEINGRDDYNLTKALNWYSYTSDLKDGRSWLLQWMKSNGYNKNDITAIRSVHDNFLIPTACWVARMANNGTKLAESNVSYLKDRIQYSIDKQNSIIEEKEAEDKPAVDLRKRIDQKNAQMWALAEEAVVDSYMRGEPSSMYDFLISNEVTPQAASYIKNQYQPIYDEVFSEDEDVKEAFGRTLRTERKFWQGVVDDLDRYIGNKKAVKVRKPRAKKEVPAVKVVAHLNFQKEDPSLKIVSILPQEILGASQLWTFNTKARKLTVFHAIGPSGLGVKGASITGFDVERSVEKTLRKPAEVIDSVLKAGRVAIKKIMSEVNSKEYPPTGRINNSTILLRVIK